MEMNVQGRRERGRPKKRWLDAIGCDRCEGQEEENIKKYNYN